MNKKLPTRFFACVVFVLALVSELGLVQMATWIISNRFVSSYFIFEDHENVHALVLAIVFKIVLLWTIAKVKNGAE